MLSLSLFLQLEPLEVFCDLGKGDDVLCWDKSLAVGLDHPSEVGVGCDVGIGKEVGEQFSEVDLLVLTALHQQGVVLLLHFIIIRGISSKDFILWESSSPKLILK